MADAGSGGPGETVSRAHRRVMRSAAHQAGRPAVLTALDSLDVMLAERLLGALEITVESLDVTAPAVLAGGVTRRSGTVGVAFLGHEGEARRAAALLDGLRPGTAVLVEAVTRSLVAHESIAPLLAVGSLLAVESGGDEHSLAAAHGAAYLAVAVAAASAVLGAIDGPAYACGPSAVIGLALGAAVVVLREVEMPPGYTDVVLAQVRAHFLLPRRAGGSVSLADGRGFALTEGGWPQASDFTGNGLVAVASGGAVIRTGIAAGTVAVDLEVRKDPPENVEVKIWDEIVEVSWSAVRGLASVVGSGDGASGAGLRATTPPWPGDYRLRVHASGRDGDRAEERYRLIVWQASAASEIVYRATDRLGHRLRGEPEPVAAAMPEAAYRWVGKTALSGGATVTIATGMAVEEVIHAFGGDPDDPESMTEIRDEQLEDYTTLIASVAVLDLGNAVVAVEHNGFHGTHGEILSRLSRQGRAASMYWSEVARRLSFAENGELLASFEPGFGSPATNHPAVLDVLRGIDLEDHRDKEEKGLVAVERFTGGVFTEEALRSIESSNTAYRLSD